MMSIQLIVLYALLFACVYPTLYIIVRYKIAIAKSKANCERANIYRDFFHLNRRAIAMFENEAFAKTPLIHKILKNEMESLSALKMSQLKNIKFKNKKILALLTSKEYEFFLEEIEMLTDEELQLWKEYAAVTIRLYKVNQRFRFVFFGVKKYVAFYTLKFIFQLLYFVLKFVSYLTKKGLELKVTLLNKKSLYDDIEDESYWYLTPKQIQN